MRVTAFKSTNNDKGLQIMLIFEKMLKNIRKNLGHSNNNISKEGFFIGMFIRDFDEHLSLVKSEQSQISN
jgi:hypothetical protein